MTRNVLTRSIVSVAALVMLSRAGSAQTSSTDTSRGLSIRYADRRISTLARIVLPKL